MHLICDDLKTWYRSTTISRTNHRDSISDTLPLSAWHKSIVIPLEAVVLCFLFNADVIVFKICNTDAVSEQTISSKQFIQSM